MTRASTIHRKAKGYRWEGVEELPYKEDGRALFKSVTRQGSQLTLSGAGDGIDIRYDLQFSGDAVTGKFTFNGEPGTLTGRRRK